MKKKLICLALCAIINLCLINSGIPLDVNAIIPGEDTYIGEEKIYCDAALTDNFEDNKVLIVLSNEASVSLMDYKTNHFSEVDCIDLRNLTVTGTNLVEAKLTGINISEMYSIPTNAITFDNYFDIDTNNFHKIFSLTLAVHDKQHVLDVIEVLIERDDVIYAGPSYIYSLAATSPNDAKYASQWACGTIDLPKAWDITTGTSAVHVGILDSGIDGSHPDLVNRVIVSLSRDFTHGGIDPVTELYDSHGHGTHVAGIVAAQGNNSVGITGVAWNIRLISLEIIDSMEYTDGETIATAVDYATSIGIPILNLSIAIDEYDHALYAAIRDYPGLFVCSAGNDSQNNDTSGHYPSNYPNSNLIAVGASTRADRKATFSNYGLNTVDIFAPGHYILSCYPVDRCLDGTHDTVNSTCAGSGYHYMSGTSMAAPYVTGVAALILSADLDATPTQIKQQIMNGAEKVYITNGNSVFSSLCVSGGRLNAYNALKDYE